MNAKNKMPNLKLLQFLCRIGLKLKHFRLFLPIVLKNKISQHLLLQHIVLNKKNLRRIVLLLAGAAVLLALLCIDYRNFVHPSISCFSNLQNPETTHAISTYDFTPDRLALAFNSTNDAFFSFPFAVKLSSWKRLRIHFSQLQGLKYMSVFYRLEGDPGFPKAQTKTQRITGKNKFSYDFLLPPGNYTHLRIDLAGYRPDAKAVIKDIRLLEVSFFFYTGSYFHLLTAAILCLLILPGTMLHALFADRRQAESETNLLLFFALSIAFYLSLYGILEASHYLAADPRVPVSLSLLVLLAALALLLFRTNRLAVLRRLLIAERQSFAAALALSVLCGILLTGFVRDPFSFDSINCDTVDGEVIFSDFTGHDNMFQYVNGTAIANNEPFSTYYADGQLMAGVQDREMLAGVIYAVFRILISAVSQDMGQSYFTYTLVGLCMNIMAIFPLIVLLRRYFGCGREWLFLLLLPLNTFVLANFYFTWFKFAGAALFVSGIVLLLRERKRPLAWLLAGAAFGLATNMHAGNALGIPLIFLLIVFMNAREDGMLSKTAVVLPLLLCIVFVLVNLPWAMVKSLYYPDHHSLFKYHYLPGSTDDQNLFSAAATFFGSHPLTEQLRYRLLNLFRSLRCSEFCAIYSHFWTDSANQLLYRWTNSEFFFFSIAIYPMLTIALINQIAVRLRTRCHASSNGSIIAPLRQEFAAVMTAAFLTVVSLMLLSYNKCPDCTNHLPMGIILMILTMLTGCNISSGAFSRCLLLIYGSVAAWRTASLFLHFL